MTSLYNKNAWITGHKGFIGSELKKYLKNYNIFPISRGDKIQKNILFSKNKKIEQNDIKKNYLFHLATNYNPNPNTIEEIVDVIQDNILFGLELLNSFDKYFFTKILFTQSYLEYFKEKDKNIYSLSKSIFASQVENIYNKKIIKVYLFDTFGINDYRNKLIQICYNLGF